jgi:hypothetical protein
MDRHLALPLSSPPLILGVAALKELGEGTSPYSSPLYKGGLRGVVQNAIYFFKHPFNL